MVTQVTIPPLLAGFAHREITPTRPLPMSGFAIRTHPAEGAHDPLFVRAIALAQGDVRALLLVFDLIGVDADFTADVATAITAHGVPREHVIVVATHTHGGPTALARAHLGAVDAGYRTELVSAAADAAREAIDRARPTTIRVATGEASGIASNRRIPGGIIDPKVRVIAFDADEQTLGMIVTYGCHPVTLGPNNLLWTRDYPGFVIDALQTTHPRTDVVFMTGPSGQVNTGHSAYASQRSGIDPHRTFARAEEIGRELARIATEALATRARPVSGPLAIHRTSVALPYAPPSPTAAADAAAWAHERAQVDVDPARAALLDIWLAWAAAQPTDPPTAHTSDVATLTIGALAFAFHPGEVFVEHAHDLERDHPTLTLVPVSHANDAPGYVPYPDAYPALGYEVAEAHRVYGAPAPFTADAARNIHGALGALLRVDG